MQIPHYVPSTKCPALYQIGHELVLNEYELRRLLSSTAGRGCVDMWKAVTELELCEGLLSQSVGVCVTRYVLAPVGSAFVFVVCP